ncbi:SAP domain-containing protein [Micromonospora sp. NBC_00362]|uniref:SAP domain-containing protein n=1 Tax=Micromonospora sp. NBC_00362 TaxID=2975975 RepID=UPI00224DB7A8|nr:SAP domain-containing protein [Micromonospora sp. NBC_00362]MCX5119220.1 SAP domain-containing protein [Micromonospora sp. NBC_00362]
MGRFVNTENKVVVSVADHKDKRFASPLWEAYTGSDSAPAAEGYEALTVPKLKAEIERRNADRDEADRVSSEGRKPDLVAALEADDKAGGGIVPTGH